MTKGVDEAVRFGGLGLAGTGTASPPLLGGVTLDFWEASIVLGELADAEHNS
jgi:hypothetical protein